MRFAHRESIIFQNEEQELNVGVVVFKQNHLSMATTVNQIFIMIFIKKWGYALMSLIQNTPCKKNALYEFQVKREVETTFTPRHEQLIK